MGPENPTRQNQPPADDEARRAEILRARVELFGLRNIHEKGGWQREVHLKDIDIAQLTDEDILMYLAIVNERIGEKEEFDRFRGKYVDEEGKPKKGVSQSTAKFIEFLENRFMRLLNRRIEKRKQEERQRGRKDSKE